MVVMKCKMCGGDLNISEESRVATCEYCGSTQTIPTPDNDKKMTLFGRAGRLLRSCEFDKAEGIFENIVAEFPEEAEAYWGLVLCKYGIEYVDDPATAKKIPTCHRSSFESVMDDSNYEQALENADVASRKIYREETKTIEFLRQRIVEVSEKERPYDIFICYKETDENGNRTIDSVLAQDIYDMLVQRGFRVFFSRISLEDKLGKEYEPYIFAALNSAKIMLAVGTDYEYYNAVWVKNEWGRFLKLIAADQKKTLIPCYRGIDAYDMPKEFARFQAQDLGKVGAMQDLLRGIKKILKAESNQKAFVDRSSENPSMSQSDNTVRLGIMSMEAGDSAKAMQYFVEALKLNADNIGAYLGIIWCLPYDRDKVRPYLDRLSAFSMDFVAAYLKNNSEIVSHNHDPLLTKLIYNSSSVDLIRLLLESGAYASEQYALFNAIKSTDRYELVPLLLKYGANPNQEYTVNYDRHSEVHTPLVDVIWEIEDYDIAKILIEDKADVNYIGKASDGSNVSPLYMAIKKNNLPIIQLLLDHGANPNQKFQIRDGAAVKTGSVFDVALQYRASFECIKMLIEHGVSVDLVWAIREDNEYMVRFLLENGANANGFCSCVSEASHDVVRPYLAVAIRERKSMAIIQLLLKYGADPNYIYRDSILVNERNIYNDVGVKSQDIFMTFPAVL